MKTKFFSFTILFFLSLAPPVFACDFCSLYIAQQANQDTSHGFHIGVAEQFTHFGTLQLDGSPVPNSVGQYLDSSVTQFVFGYGFNDTIGIQLNLPLIYRNFRRPHDGMIQQGSVTGIGDMVLLGKLQPYRYLTDSISFRWHFIGGIKFPTGSSSLIAEELTESDSEGDPQALPPSGIHGHDLALGSGSWDATFGTDLYTRFKRFFFLVNAELNVRTQGSFGYRYANEVQWNTGPGAYLILNHLWTLALQARVSGEYKGLDNLAGLPAPDTGINAVYMGPELSLTWKNHLSAHMGADLPLLLNNTDLQIVPDYRVRVALIGHF